MNSGLDDFPRNNEGTSKKTPAGHIDCQSWMYFFASVMKNIAEKKNYEKALGKYKDIIYNIKYNMKFFIDPKDNLLKDILLD